MLRSMKELFGYAVTATDGTIGKVEDFLFDETTHDVRYVVVDTGGWINRHHVLLAPAAFVSPRWPARDFSIGITCDQVRSSPELVTDAPLSRRHEAAVHSHYEWVPYWLMHGHGAPTAHVEEVALCRARQIIGYRLHATDYEFGHLSDFIIDDSSWCIPFLIADTEQWWPPQMSMVAMSAFRDINIVAEQVDIALTERLIRESPAYDPTTVAGRRHELVGYDYHGRPHA